jgi:hypothetical protein
LIYMVSNMTFKLKIEKYRGTEEKLRIVGKIISGAYTGPEMVYVETKGGRKVTGIIRHESFSFFEGWPILPGHNTLVKIDIDLHEKVKPGLIDKCLNGTGPIMLNEKRMEISAEFDNPQFWYGHLNEILLNEEGESLAKKIFDLNTRKANDYNEELLQINCAKGIWPFLRIPVDGGDYMEIEYSEGVEPQTRYWIGRENHFRILLGYESSHLSLPGIRLAEMKTMLKKVSKSEDAVKVMAWLPCCYLEPNDDLNEIIEVLRKIPGLRKNGAELICNHLSTHQRFEVVWTNNHQYGWINNWDYSQRNPKSMMSLLDQEDFSNIESFFSEKTP